MIFILLAVLGALAWLISTLAAGGAATLLLPILGLLLGAQAVPPVITLASIIANPSRAAIFSRHINWKVLASLGPGTLIGSVAGAFFFTLLDAKWIQIALGIFLVSTLLQYRMGQIKKSFPMTLYWFFPLGLSISFISGVVGAAGPVLNPFFLNYGLEKDELIATKACNSLIMQLLKIVTYGSLGALSWSLAGYGIAVGVGAILGILLAKHYLGFITEAFFRQILLVFMPASGLLLIVKALWID